MPAPSSVFPASNVEAATAGSLRECAASGRPKGVVRRDGSTLAPMFVLLPRSVRTDLSLLYGILRALDDLVDGGDPTAVVRIHAVEKWCRGGQPESTETHILQTMSTRHALPVEPLLDFCQGMRQDMAHATIETEADLDRYCYLVGGTVGMLSAAILGTTAAAAQAKAAALGMAIQRTHVLRDLDEDLAAGRVYVAREAIERFGSLERRRRAALMRDQVARADALFEEGIPGIGLLPRGRRAVLVAANLYREILRQIERDDYATCGRPVVPRWRRLAVIAQSVASPFPRG